MVTDGCAALVRTAGARTGMACTDSTLSSRRRASSILASRVAKTFFAVTAGVALAAATEKEAAAFATKGHRVLEAAAYRELLFDDRGGVNERGRAVLRRLISDGVLARPPCVDGESRCSDVEKRDDPLLWWPVPGTDDPDMVMSRQFSAAGQCYHFMATKEDERGSVPGNPSSHLRVDAPNRCVAQLDELFRYIVVAPDTARQNQKGTYELLHAIADSYSFAHVERDYANWDPRSGGDPAIRFLRVWQPTVRWPWADESLETRHEIIEERDDNFIQRFETYEGRPCTAQIDKPYFVPAKCLSREGRLAVRAMREALETIDETRRASAGKLARDIDWRPWTMFKARHFAVGEPGGSVALPSERAPLLSIGNAMRFEHERIGAASSLESHVEGRFFYGGAELDPVVLMPSMSVGGRWYAGGASEDARRPQSEFVYRAGGTVGLPAFDRVILGLTPLSFEAAVSQRSMTYNAFASARVDWFPHRALALSFISPEYSWVAGRMHLSFGLGLAYVLGRETGGAAPVGDGARVAAAADPVDWRPSTAADVELRSSRGPKTLQVFAGAAGGRPTGNTTVGKLRQGLELLLFKRNAWGERRSLALAVGVMTSVEFGRPSDTRYPAFTGELFVAPRYYIAGPIAVFVQAAADTGNEIDRTLGALGRAGLLATFGRLDVVVESPTYSTARGAFLPEELLGVRLSVETFQFGGAR